MNRVSRRSCGVSVRKYCGSRPGIQGLTWADALGDHTISEYLRCGGTILPEQAVPLQFGRSGLTDVFAEYRAVAAGVAIAPGVSVVMPALGGARNER